MSETLRRETPEEYVKRLIITRAGRSLSLPCNIEDIPHGTPAERWYDALTNDNPPGKFRIDLRKDRPRFERFRTAVNALDMRVFDRSLAEMLRSEYGATAELKRIEVDADSLELPEEEA